MNNFYVTYYTDETHKTIRHTCSCGNTWVNEDFSNICDSCKTQYRFHISNNDSNNRITYGNMLRLVESGDWGFIVDKVNTKAKFDKANNVLTLLSETKSTLYYDFRSNNFSIVNNKGVKSPITENNMQYFFRYLNEDEFINYVSTEKIRNLLRLSRSAFGHTRSNNWYSRNRLHRGMAKITGRKYYQILSSAGFNYKFLNSYCGVINKHYYNGECIDEVFDKTATKPHEILKVPKYILNYIKEIDVTYDTFVNIKSMDKEFGADCVRNILDRFVDECGNKALSDFLSKKAELFVELCKDYKYEPKRLAEYVCRDVKLQQGMRNPIEALELLKDCIRITSLINMRIDKYSKSLKKDHDIAAMNYDINKDQYLKSEFLQIVSRDTYKGLTFKSKEYKIITPTEPNDLMLEGKNLSHCVASYVKDVVEGKCKIFFMRNKENTNESLLTIEVRNNKVIQVKGFGNRGARVEEVDFLKKWSQEKGLSYCA